MEEITFGEWCRRNGLGVVVGRPTWTPDGREEITITLSGHIQDARLYDAVEALGLEVGSGGVHAVRLEEFSGVGVSA